MDFADILKQWENRKPPKPGSIGNAPKSGDADKTHEKRVNPIDQWLRINGTIDKDALSDGEESDAVENRRRLRQKKPDAVIDIHGHTRDEAYQALEQFFHTAHERDLEKILVIHGKGNHSQGEAVLKNTVREFIEHCPFAGESGQSSPSGSGATWVILKK